MPNRALLVTLAAFAASLASALVAPEAAAQSARALDARAQAVIDHWTPAARAAAIPRDLVIDERGLGYLRLPDKSLVPYGHNVAAAQPTPLADTTGPTVSGQDPAAGATIGASYTFKATVTDASGVKSVSFKVQKGTGLAQSFTPSAGANGVYSIALSGFTDGSWNWWVVAKDSGPKGGNTTTSTKINFTVATGGGGGGGGGGGTVSSAEWLNGGVVQNAAGRIYFEMPSNARRTRWAGYVCSGTVVNDATSGRSVILTASHCVYDDSNKAFARNVMFIPDQADTSASGTDLNCSNDKFGCWVPNFGVVDTNWTTRTFPDNVAWDYAFYVVDDTASVHTAGYTANVSNVLDAAVAPMSLQFTAPTIGSLAHALGYSYDMDPKFMYCTDLLANESNGVDYWLGGCGLTGGSSGGPWVQPMNESTGNGPIISVNSWGYTNSPGMAGPKLSGTSASCVFGNATSQAFGTFNAGDAGYAVTCP